MSFEDRFSTLLEVLDVSKRREASYQAELHEFAATVEYRVCYESFPSINSFKANELQKSAVIVTKRILTAVALRKAHTDKSQPELVPKGATSSFLEQSTKLTPETRDYFRKVRSAVTPLDREFTSAAHQVAVRTAGFHINSTQDHEEHEAYSDLLLYATGLAPFVSVVHK